jgi:hypothetical protein
MSAEQAPRPDFEHIDMSETSEISPESCFVVTAYKSDHFRSFNVLETERATWVEVTSMGTLPDGTEQTDPEDEMTRSRSLLRDAVNAAADKHNASLPNHEQPHAKGDWMLETMDHQIVTDGVRNELEERRLEKVVDTFQSLNEWTKDGEFGVKLVSSQQDQPPVLATLAGFTMISSETDGEAKTPVLLITSEAGDETGVVPRTYRIAGTYAKKS